MTIQNVLREDPLEDLIRASHNTIHSISCCDQNSTLFLKNRTGTPEEGSSSESEFEEFPASRDQLKARVYSPLGSKKLYPRLRHRVVCLRNFPLLTSLFLNLSMFPQLFK